MDSKQICVNILRLNDKFIVNCSEKTGIRDFKEKCRRLSKYPLEKFVLIVEGKEINENDVNCWKTVLNSKRVYIFVQSFYKNDEPDEFIRVRRMKKLFEDQFSDKSRIKGRGIYLALIDNDDLGRKLFN